MNSDITNEPDTLTDIADRADVLIHDAHDALERMDTRLTLAEAKVALVRHMIARRHLREDEQQA
jgi:predicted DNA-binding protein YlxM (UPF0122 family)